jgi:hypothetical protein
MLEPPPEPAPEPISPEPAAEPMSPEPMLVVVVLLLFFLPPQAASSAEIKIAITKDVFFISLILSLVLVSAAGACQAAN